MNKEDKIFKLDKKEICITSTQIKQAIDLLVNENEILQDRIYELKDEIEKLKKENEELNNIIEELEKSWKEQQEYYRYRKDNRYRTFLSKNLDKLKELKEGK